MQEFIRRFVMVLATTLAYGIALGGTAAVIRLMTGAPPDPWLYWVMAWLGSLQLLHNCIEKLETIAKALKGGA